MQEIGEIGSKVKIMVATGQIYSYFSVVFDVPWPRFTLNLWSQLQLFSFDLYAVFGEWDCRMQTTFLQKFPLHMTLLPILIFCIVAAYLIAYIRLKCCCTQKWRKRMTESSFDTVKCCGRTCMPLYTVESAQTKTMYIIQFMFFNLYT